MRIPNIRMEPISGSRIRLPEKVHSRVVPMRNQIIILSLFSGVCSLASLRPMYLFEKVKNADLIVIGKVTTISEISETRTQGLQRTECRVAINEVLWPLTDVCTNDIVVRLPTSQSATSKNDNGVGIYFFERRAGVAKRLEDWFWQQDISGQTAERASVYSNIINRAIYDQIGTNEWHFSQRIRGEWYEPLCSITNVRVLISQVKPDGNVPAIALLQQELSPIFRSLGAADQPRVTENGAYLTGTFNTEFRSFGEVDSSANHPKTNGVFLFVAVVDSDRSQPGNKNEPYPQIIKKEDHSAYMHFFPVPIPPDGHNLEVLLLYGPQSDHDKVNAIQTIINNHAQRMAQHHPAP